MAKKFVVAYRKDPNNVGDIASNPLQYFLKEDEYDAIDVANLGKDPYDDHLPMIIGGGGLIGNNFFGDDYFKELLESSDRLALERMYNDAWVVKNPNYKDVWDEFHTAYQNLMHKTLEKIQRVSTPRFVWGAGHNGEPDVNEMYKIRWPKALANYKLVGIRDYSEDARFNWVPCASCMHPALEKKYTIKNEIIFFEHKKQLIKATEFGNEAIPRFVNSGNNIEQTIELLGSANTILTNSYHGAYWGILLGKRVIIAGGPWSSKFHFFKHKVPIPSKKEDWRDFLQHNQIYPDALEECREVTKNWWKKIQECI